MSSTEGRLGLEILEKSDLDILPIIEHVISILKIDLAKTTQAHLKREEGAEVKLEYTFREQWVLRWLLKRFAAEETQHRRKQDGHRSTRYQ